MERPFPPSSPFISPSPEQQPPTTSPDSIEFLLSLFVIDLIISFTYLLGHFLYRRLFPSSQQVPDRTPSDALQLLKSNQVIIDIEDSSTSSSSSRTKVEPSELGSCPICLEEMAVEGEETRILPRCRHVYHRACIDQWLIMGSEICPLCRDRVMFRLTGKSTSNHDRTENDNDGENSSSVRMQQRSLARISACFPLH